MGLCSVYSSIPVSPFSYRDRSLVSLIVAHVIYM